VIDKVGIGVDAARVGERVWIWGAQSYRPMGTAAEFTVVPDDHAVMLPAGVSDDVGACLGIPGITAHRAVFADGAVDASTVLVHGVRGAVGSLAAALATWGGARVVGTVRSRDDVDLVTQSGIAEVVSLDALDAVDQIRAVAPEGVDRVVEVSLSDNVALDAAVLRVGGVIAAYASRDGQPSLPFWPMLFDNLTIRLLGSDDFPTEAKLSAARDVTLAVGAGALFVEVRELLPLAAIASAHEAVDAGGAGRVVLAIE
jgi:NADPH2:quinone reductase